jgi:hypothetical protein
MFLQVIELFKQPILPYTDIGLLAAALLFMALKDHIKPHVGGE